MLSVTSFLISSHITLSLYQKFTFLKKFYICRHDSKKVKTGDLLGPSGNSGAQKKENDAVECVAPSGA